MELDTLFEKLQNKLMLNDQKLEDIDTRRKELKKIGQEEQFKIVSHCSEVQARVGAAVESLKVKMVSHFTKLDQELALARENVRKDSLVLCPELEKITELVRRGDEDRFDMDESWDKIKNIITRNQDCPTTKNPTFHPSKTMAKVKSSDLGFLNVAEYLPNQYQLIMTSPLSNLMVAGINTKAVCTVTTSEQFTEMIQANIKFSIKNKACKESVPYCKEECKLSEDRKSFQIAFMVQKPGTYMVTVLLYDQHVTDSPLTLLVSDDKGLDMETADTKEMNQSSPKFVGAPIVAEPTVNQEPVYVTKKAADPTPSIKPSKLPSVAAPIRHPTLPSKVIPSPQGPVPTPSSPLPRGPLDLSHIPPGGRLSGLRMLSIEEGTKEESLHKPIGMCLLQNGNIVVASTFEDKVKMFTPMGKFFSLVTAPQPFERPSDMVSLQSGEFVVRDNTRVQVFSANGNFMKSMWQDKGQDKCYGLAQDKEGRLVTIMESRRPRKTDLLFFDLITVELVKKIEMEDIIANKAMSKCRFLTYQLGKLYITDLGLDCVYILDPVTINAKVFGSSGSGPGQLSDPAGLVVDTVGNIIVADSKNHRLCLFTMEGKFLCNLSLSPDTRRPSGVSLDKDKLELYVLNLQGKAAMIKYKLK